MRARNADDVSVGISSIDDQSLSGTLGSIVAESSLKRHIRRFSRRMENEVEIPEEGRPVMSAKWEKASKFLSKQDGDRAALAVLRELLIGNAFEATHQPDATPPHWTLLHKAAASGCHRCAELLVENHAVLDLRDREGACVRVDVA